MYIYYVYILTYIEKESEKSLQRTESLFVLIVSSKQVPLVK